MSLLGLISARPVPPVHGCMNVGCQHMHRGRSELGQGRDALPARRDWVAVVPPAPGSDCSPFAVP